MRKLKESQLWKQVAEAFEVKVYKMKRNLARDYSDIAYSGLCRAARLVSGTSVLMRQRMRDRLRQLKSGRHTSLDNFWLPEYTIAGAEVRCVIATLLQLQAEEDENARG